MIDTGFLAIGVAFFASWILIPALAGPARWLGLLDRPSQRKRHLGAIPLTGGVAMFIAVALAMVVKGMNGIDYATLAIGMSVLLAKGIVDDLIDIRALVKLLTQVAVSVIAVHWGGLDLTQLGHLFGPSFGAVGLGPFGPVFSVVAMVFLINVINMADGLDGLAGGISFLIFLLLGLVALLAGAEPSLVTVSLVLAAATAGFLSWNMRFPFRSRAAAFMGDAGSMMLGFAAAWLAIAVAKSPAEQAVYPVTIALILLVPSMDTFALFFRRISQGRNPMSPDRTHLHHILMRSGLSVTATVACIHLSVLATGLFGIAMWQLGVPESFLFAIVAGAFAVYTVAVFNARNFLRWRLKARRSNGESA